jgi:hypothetical protein
MCNNRSSHTNIHYKTTTNGNAGSKHRKQTQENNEPETTKTHTKRVKDNPTAQTKILQHRRIK